MENEDDGAEDEDEADDQECVFSMFYTCLPCVLQAFSSFPQASSPAGTAQIQIFDVAPGPRLLCLRASGFELLPHFLQNNDTKNTSIAFKTQLHYIITSMRSFFYRGSNILADVM